MKRRRPSLLIGPSDPSTGSGQPPGEPADREPLLDRQPFGMPWRSPTWLIVLWTALVVVLGFAAYTEPANSGSLTFGLLLLATIWGVGMIPLGLLWVAAWFRRRRDAGRR